LLHLESSLFPYKNVTNITSTTMEQTAAAAPPPPILRLPDEVLDRIFAHLFRPAFKTELPLAWDDPPPSQDTLRDLVAVAATCRRFHPIAGPHLYRSVWFDLPDQPAKRIHRLHRTFFEHPEVLALCKWIYTGELPSKRTAVMVKCQSRSPPKLSGRAGGEEAQAPGEWLGDVRVDEEKDGLGVSALGW
jgi:hypothetical protein